jgi:hypothetical protein
VLVWSRRRTIRQRVAVSLPFLGVVAGCVLASLYLRRLYLSAESTSQVNGDVFAFLMTLARQTSAAIPLSYFLRNDAGIFPVASDPRAVAGFILTKGGLVAFAGALLTCLGSLPADDREAGRLGPGRTALLAAVGLLLAILPGVMTSLGTKYQQMVKFGLGYLPVYLQYFGAGLLLGTLAWSALSRATAGGAWRRGLGLALAILLALTTSLTYRANAVLADYLPKAEGSPGYKPAVGFYGGRWHYHRRNLEVALQAGLVEDVPDHSVVHLANEYPHWHDTYHSRYFYAMHSSKVLQTIPRASRFKGFNWFVPKDSLRVPRSGAAHYVIRDIPLAEKAGYVVLSREIGREGEERASPCGAGGGVAVRLFVRHPKLFANGPNPRVVVSGDLVADEADGSGRPFVRTGQELTAIHTGPDWALLSLGPDAAGVDPDSVVVSFGPASFSWGPAFITRRPKKATHSAGAKSRGSSC